MISFPHNYSGSHSLSPQTQTYKLHGSPRQSLDSDPLLDRLPFPIEGSSNPTETAPPRRNRICQCIFLTYAFLVGYWSFLPTPEVLFIRFTSSPHGLFSKYWGLLLPLLLFLAISSASNLGLSSGAKCCEAACPLVSSVPPTVPRRFKARPLFLPHLPPP